ncbi:MAG: hypothetical protein ACKVS9_11920 [Phycisphaerae bacterium]
MQQYLQLLEKHIEKVILGLAGVFTLYMLYAYMISSPYQIEFAGKKVVPAALHGEILDSAKGLEVAVRNATGDSAPVEKFSDKLQAALSRGIFADATVSESVRRTVAFGTDIAVKGMEEADDAGGPIALVRPLAPSQPRFVQGRSSIVPKQAELTAAAASPNAPGTGRGTGGRGGALAPGGTGDEPEKAAGPPPIEDSWVTIASYFDVSGQREAMAKARYRSHLQKAEFVGMDVERRERQSDGQWSEWKPVAAGMAMPKVEIPEPAIDDAGVLKNREALNAMRAQVRAEQARLMQPPFFEVKDGEQWSTPPLPGHEPAVEEDVVKRPPPKPPKDEPPPNVRQQGTGGGGGPVAAGGGGGRGRGGPRGGGRRVPQADDPAAKEEARKQAKSDLDEARKMMAAKEYDAAMDLANNVKENTEATQQQQNQAEAIVADAMKKLEAASGEGAPGVTGTGGRFGGGPRGGGRGQADPDVPKITLITNPEGKKETAVWFHDDSVEPGKTYQYRTRVRLWNRYVGDMKALQNPQEARSAIIAGDWSPISDDITVRPLRHFFVSAGRAGEGKASVEVWARHKGKWVEKKFEVGSGDRIGGVVGMDVGEVDENQKKKKTDIDFSTGAIVVDIRTAMAKVRTPAKGNSFRVDERESIILTYIDPADGQVKERVQIAERHDPDKKRIERETENT